MGWRWLSLLDLTCYTNWLFAVCNIPPCVFACILLRAKLVYTFEACCACQNSLRYVLPADPRAPLASRTLLSGSDV